MGEVYLAQDTKLKRQVAIKFLPEHLTKDKENVERFEREAEAAAALNHPNIVTIHDVIEDFLKLGNAINSGESAEAVRARETKLFTKYLKTLITSF